MNKFILFLFNEPIARVTMGIIITGTVGSPFINGFSENVIWFSLMALTAIAFGWLLLSRYSFTSKTVWVCYVIMAAFAALVTYLYFAYGR